MLAAVTVLLGSVPVGGDLLLSTPPMGGWANLPNPGTQD